MGGRVKVQVQYPDEDGEIVRKQMALVSGGDEIAPEQMTKEILINHFLDLYRSSNPFAKIVMSPYNIFYE